MPRRTKAEAAQTRALIIKTAEKLFYEKGVVRTSLQEVAEAAQVTRGAIYWHFKDKADLLWAMADDIFMPHEELLDHLVAQKAADPLTNLYNSTTETMHAIVNNPRRRRVFTILTNRCEYVEDLAHLKRRNNATRDRLYLRLKALFEQIEARGLLAAGWAPATAATALQTFVIGAIHVEMEYPSPSKKRDRERNDAIDAFFRCLGRVDDKRRS